MGRPPFGLFFIRTGGTEGIFRNMLPGIGGPVFLLTSGQSNSLAASMEILSYLRQTGRDGEIIHGSAEYIADRINLLAKTFEARAKLRGTRFGVIGKPSDWLISSQADYDAVKRILGAEIVDIPMQELMDEIARKSYPEVNIRRDFPEEALDGALEIYGAIKRIVAKYGLSAVTLRCFDLLGPVGNTGCLALALLNSEGIAAGCEGDIPAMLSMAIAQAVTGCPGFQSNPSRIDLDTSEMILAHCTIPLDMVESYRYDTHFESGIGVAIKGEVKEGPVTVFKVSGDLSSSFIAEGTLVRNLDMDSLCRTQLLVRFDSDRKDYFLKNPIGNHHIVLCGHHASCLKAFVDTF